MARATTHKSREVHVKVPTPLFETYKMLADENGLAVSSIARLAMIDYVKKRPSAEGAPMEIVLEGKR